MHTYIITVVFPTVHKNGFEKYGHIASSDELMCAGASHIYVHGGRSRAAVQSLFHLNYFSYLLFTDYAHMLYTFTHNLCTSLTQYSTTEFHFYPI